MKVNNESIYATRPIAPYRDGKLCFTRGKDGAVYAIYLLDEGEIIPESISLKGIAPAPGAKIRLLGSDLDLKWQRADAGARITLPEAASRQTTGSYAVALRISAIRT